IAASLGLRLEIAPAAKAVLRRQRAGVVAPRPDHASAYASTVNPSDRAGERRARPVMATWWAAAPTADSATRPHSTGSSRPASCTAAATANGARAPPTALTAPTTAEMAP